jgi:hypothetical protein
MTTFTYQDQEFKDFVHGGIVKTVKKLIIRSIDAMNNEEKKKELLEELFGKREVITTPG